MRKLFTILVFLISLASNAQGFRTRYLVPGSKNNSTRAIFETTAGNYIAGAIIQDSINGQYTNRLCLIGLNSQGQVQWTKEYGSYKFLYYDNPYISRWFYKQGNNLYFTCGARDSNNKNIGVLIKFNFNGDSLWQKIYRDSADIVAPQRVTGSVDGGFFITGFFDSGSARTAMVLKTDASGNELWRKKIHKNVPDVEDGRGIVQDSVSKRILIVGYQYIGDANFWETHTNVLILDSLGNLIHRTTYGQRGSFFDDLIQTKDKKFVAAGSMGQIFQVNGYDALKRYAVKFDTSGISTLWSVQAGIAATGTHFSSVNELSNGDLILGGIQDTMEIHSRPINQFISHTRLNSSGSILKDVYYNYKSNHLGQDNIMNMLCLNPTSDGGLIAAIEISNDIKNPFFIVKYDSTGCDSSLAYCAAVAAGIQTSELNGTKISIYPNPAYDHVNIEFESINKNLEACFTDLTGREIKRTPLDQPANVIDIKSMESGMYLLKIENKTHEFLYQGKFLKTD